MKVMVYKFGLLPPTENADIIHQEMFDGHLYRNDLTGIERGVRTYMRTLHAEIGDEQVLLQAKKEAEKSYLEALHVVKAQRASTRSCSEGPEEKAREKETKSAFIEAKNALVGYRQALREHPDVVTRTVLVTGKEPRKKGEEKRKRDNTQKNNGLRAQLERAARALRKCSWGTGALIEAAAGKARCTPYYDTNCEPNDPKFVRWRGEGHIGVQIQRGIQGVTKEGVVKKKEELFLDGVFSDKSKWLRIAPVPPEAWDQSTPRGIRRKLCRTVLQLRLRTENKEPVWGSWPMIMHRAIPKDARITGVQVSIARIGARAVWTCEITVAEPLKTSCGSGIVALRVGWRSIPGKGLQVGSLLDITGKYSAIHMPPKDIEGLASADHLRSIRDKNFKKALVVLIEGLRKTTMPEWMRMRTVRWGQPLPSQAQALAYLSEWKSSARLASLVLRWANNRWPGDEELFGCRPLLEDAKKGAQGPGAEGWRYRDKHLWEYEAGRRERSLLRRREGYRKLAKALAQEYGTLLVVDQDLSRIAKKKEISDETPEVQAARTNRQRAAPSELRSVLINAIVGRGGTMVKVKVSSHTCPACEVEEAIVVDSRKGTALCVSCPVAFLDLDQVVLMNVLRAAGYGDEVAAMFERLRKVALPPMPVATLEEGEEIDEEVEDDA